MPLHVIKGSIPYLDHILKERVELRTSGSKSRAGIGAESLYTPHFTLHMSQLQNKPELQNRSSKAEVRLRHGGQI